MKYSAHKLLSGQDGLLTRITPTDDEMGFLAACRRKIRSAVRGAFREVSHTLTQDTQGRYIFSGTSQLTEEINESIRRLDAPQKKSLKGLTPKFAPQGSVVYKTINSPCHKPPQEMDMDDGVYLPLEVLQEQPVISKELFFEIVDDALKTLAKEEGWKFEKKETCARLRVDSHMHIDMPLYAIPADRHEQLAALRAFDSFSSECMESRQLLQDGNVYLAVRSKSHWIKSDPMLVKNWFEGAVASQGLILRRVSRYLKAWRDFTFEKGGPSSITLMACATETMDSDHYDDDSHALMACATSLAAQLERGVDSPVDETEPQLFPRDQMSPEERQSIINQARELERNLNLALIESETPEEALHYLRASFGDRLPFNPDALTLYAVAAVTNTPANKTPRPKIPNRKSGIQNTKSG